MPLTPSPRWEEGWGEGGSSWPMPQCLCHGAQLHDHGHQPHIHAPAAALAGRAPGEPAHPGDHGVAVSHRAFAIGVALNTIFVVVEAVFGVLSGSLALIADAGHNLSDVLGLLLAWGALALMRREPTARRTYGFRRASILSALVNAMSLFVVVGGVVWEALHRLQDPTPVSGVTVIVVAAVGVAVNGASAALFLAGRSRDVNIRGAFLHLAADAAVSLGVVAAGVGVVLTGWMWLDPLMSLVVSLVIVVGAWRLLLDALNLALDAVPNQINPDAVRLYLASVPRVLEVHDLHIWAMSSTETALTVHLVMVDATLDDGLLAAVQAELHVRFDIDHATIQLECGDPAYPCVLAPAQVI